MLRTSLPFILGGAFMLGQLLRESLEHHHMTLTQGAQWMDIDVSQFKRQLDGVEHLSLKRMEKLPIGVLQWFAWGLVWRVGLPQLVRRSWMVEFALMGKRRQLRVQQAEQKAEQTA